MALAQPMPIRAWPGLGPGRADAPPPSPRTGSPKRHHFQRQRAASESMEQEGAAPHGDFIQYIASAGAPAAFPPPRPFLAGPASPPPALGRYFSVDRGARGWPGGPCSTPPLLGGPGSALSALRTGGCVPQVPPPLLEAALPGPPPHCGPEQGSRGTLGKGRGAGGAPDDSPKVPRTGHLLRQGCWGSAPARVGRLRGGVEGLRDILPLARAPETLVTMSAGRTPPLARGQQS